MSIFSRKAVADFDDFMPDSGQNPDTETRTEGGSIGSQDILAIRRCLECKSDISHKNAQANYCNERCSKAYRRRQEKISEKKRSYLSGHPDISEEDLDNALAEAMSILDVEDEVNTPDPIFAEILSMTAPYSTELETDDGRDHQDYEPWQDIKHGYELRAYTPMDRLHDDGTQAEKFRARAIESRRLNRKSEPVERRPQEFSDARTWDRGSTPTNPRSGPALGPAGSQRSALGRRLPARYLNASR